MSSYEPAKKATTFIFYLGLVSQSNSKVFQANPTLATGDFKVSIDGAALANLGTTPTVTPAGGKMVKVTLDGATEMNGDNITLVCSDAAGSEWCDQIINIPTVTNQFNDLATPTNITAGTITTATNVTTVNGLAANVITATSIAADAITDAKVASDVTIASVTGAVGSVTGAVGSVTGAVGSVTGNVGGNVTGSVGSVTGLTASNLDATVSSRLASASYTAPPSAATISTQVGTDLSGTHGAGSWATATGFSTVAATDIVSGGAITTSGGIASSDVNKINGVTILGDGSATPFHV